MITVYDECREHLKSPDKTSFVLWFLKKSTENYLQDNKIERIKEIHRVWQSNVDLDILIKPRLEIRSYSAWRWSKLNIQKIVCQKMLKLYFHKSPLIPLLHTDHESPERHELIFFIRGDSWGFIVFSPIVMSYESFPIQIRCRYEYSGESAQFDWNRTRILYD